MNVGLHKEEYERTNVEVTGAARLYRAASVWTAGLALCTRTLQVQCNCALWVGSSYRVY